jgi:membrane-bound lytic murein transglycosylase MltF
MGVAFCCACSDWNSPRKTTEVINPEQQEEVGQFEEKQLFLRVNEPFKGDLEQIRERRLIRVLVSYSKTNFFIDDTGVVRGFEYELLHQYEKFLNKSISNRYHQVKMVFIRVPFDQLLLALQDGRGDIAAAGLTITQQRESYVNFTEPYIPDVREIVVVNSRNKQIDSLEDLSGEMLYVLSGSSFVTHLEALNKKFVQKGILPIQVVESDPNLVAEDILELLNAGILNSTVPDQHIAEAWSQVLSEIILREDLQINTGGRISWAVRKENPDLLANLNTFIKKNKKGSLLGNILIKRYYKNAEWVKNPVSEEEQQKLQTLDQLFTKYADRYGFDWLAIAAQAYQESGLDNSKRSPDGAIGIMQVMPQTASYKAVNISDVHLLENNIHAGVKYLHFLRERYFSTSEIEPASRVNLSWAAYNAGPAKINRLRNIAKKRGFDPNKWFFNVEKIAAELIGRETVEYVANINKYYVAYKLQEEENQKRERSRRLLTALNGG